MCWLGVPSEINSHPQRSDAENSFVVVHNGIITNYKDVKNYLESKGHTFESETDTEIIAKLIYHLYREHPNYSFRELVEQVIQQLVSVSFLCFVRFDNIISRYQMPYFHLWRQFMNTHQLINNDNQIIHQIA